MKFSVFCLCQGSCCLKDVHEACVLTTELYIFLNFTFCGFYGIFFFFMGELGRISLPGSAQRPTALGVVPSSTWVNHAVLGSKPRTLGTQRHARQPSVLFPQSKGFLFVLFFSFLGEEEISPVVLEEIKAIPGVTSKATRYQGSNPDPAACTYVLQPLELSPWNPLKSVILQKIK